MAPGAPDYTGRYFDGFGNRMTVHAVANPRADGVAPERLHSRAPGYGIVRVVRDAASPGGGRVTLEAWPRHVDPTSAGAAPFAGWPVDFSLGEGEGRVPAGYLPSLKFERQPGEAAKVEVLRDGEVVYCWRWHGSTLALPVFDRDAAYSVRVSVTAGADGARGWVWERAGLRAQERSGTSVLDVARER